MTWPVVHWDQVRTISSIALRQADTEALTTFGIEPLRLMEVAGWQIARFVDAFTHGIRNKRVIVVAGVPLGTPGATNMLRIAYVGPTDADVGRAEFHRHSGARVFARTQSRDIA